MSTGGGSSTWPLLATHSSTNPLAKSGQSSWRAPRASVTTIGAGRNAASRAADDGVNSSSERSYAPLRYACGVCATVARRPGGSSPEPSPLLADDACAVVSNVIRKMSHFFRCGLNSSVADESGGGRRENAEPRRLSVSANSRWRKERGARGYRDRTVASAIAFDDEEEVEDE